MANSLIKKSFIYFIGNMASKATTALIVPIYAYFVNPEALGSFDYLQTIMTCLAPFCFMAVWEAVLRFMLNEHDEHTMTSSLSTVMAICLIATAATAVCSLIISVFIEGSSGMVWPACAMIDAFGCASVWQYLCRAYGESRLYSFSGAVAAVVNLLLILLSVCGLRMQLAGLVISYVSGQLAIIAIIEARLRFLSRARLSQANVRLAKRFISFSAPLALNLLFMSCVTGFGRILITNVLGAEANGLYTFALRFATIITTLGSIFSMAVIEESVLRIGAPKEANERFFTAIITNTAVLLLSICVIALPLVRLFYSFIRETPYYDSFGLVPIFLLYACCSVMGTITGNVLQVTNHTDVTAIGSFLGAAVTAVTSIILVGVLGSLGVEMGLLFGSITIFVFRFVYGRTLIRFDVGWRAIIAFLVLYGIVSLVCISSVVEGSVAAQVLIFCVFSAISAPFFIRSANAIRMVPDAGEE